MTRPLLTWLAAYATACLLPAQPVTWTSIPPGYLAFPGDSGVSLPARWAQGRMQIIVESTIIPTDLPGKTIKRVRVRRPALVAEPAYAARTLTMTLTLGVPTKLPGFMVTDIAQNRPATTTVVAGPLSYSIPATNPHGPGDPVAADLVDLPLSTPYLFPSAPGGLYLEWETASPTLDVSAGHWVDAIYSFGGTDLGGAFMLGNGGCGTSTTLSPPMQLGPGDTVPPTLGGPCKIALRGAKSGSDAWLRFGQEDTDTNLPPIGSGIAFGAPMSGIGMPGCWFWSTTAAITLKSTTDFFGQVTFTLTLPNIPALRGQRLQSQAYCRDASLNALGLAASNGLVLVPNEVGVKAAAATVFCFGAGVTVSQWPVFVGTIPVLLLGY